MPADVGFFGALRCLMGRHTRSKGAAKATPEGWTSKCVRCGVPMVRAHGGGKWLIVNAPLVKKVDIKGDVAPTEAMVAAIARSRESGARREEKATLKANKLAAKAAKIEQRAAAKAAAAARPRKGLLRRRVEPATGFAAIATAAHHVEVQPKPKRSLFRRKAKSENAEMERGAAAPAAGAIEKLTRGRKAKAKTDADVVLTKPESGLLRRKPKAAPAQEEPVIDTPPLTEAQQPTVAKPKRRPARRKADPAVPGETPATEGNSEG